MTGTLRIPIIPFAPVYRMIGNKMPTYATRKMMLVMICV